MKRAFLAVLVPISLLPFSAYAAECSADDVTVVYVNGIFTDTRDKAEQDKAFLKTKFETLQHTLTGVNFIAGYNPSHLAGLGDLVESVSQEMNAPLSNFDLTTILNQIHSEIHTRKILLVGHSQGTFYTNEMYNYLTSHGVSPQSIAVYNIATPANTVAGGGGYLTSSNDKVIEAVRSWDSRFKISQPLPANIAIPQSADDVMSDYGGHYLSTVYLRGAPGRIISDISNALSSLRADGDETSECFTAPGEGIAYTIGKTAFAVADPVATGVRSGGIAIANGAVFAGDFAVAFVGNAIAEAKAIAGFAVNPTSVLPPANMDTALHGLNVVHVLYGSSVTGKDVQDLLYDNQSPSQQTNPSPVQKPPVTVAQKETKAKVQGAVLGVSVEAPPDISSWIPQFPNVMIGGGGGASPASAAPPASDSTLPSFASSTPEAATTTPLAAPIFSVSECDHSLSTSFCLIPKTSASLSWSPSGGSTYQVFVNGTLSASTADTSATIPLAANASSTIEVAAVDSLGSVATSSSIEVLAYPTPVRINEIGWGGTDASSADQWVELKNMTPYTLDLSSLTLSAQSGAFSIPLSGILSAPDGNPSYEGFLTLVKNTGMTAAPIHTLSAPALSLSSIGEEIHLIYSDAANTITDTTPAVTVCGGWCAGSAAQATRFYNGVASAVEPVSMERAGSDGSLSDSWASNDTYTSGALTVQDVLGNVVRGTPGFANSNHYPLYGWFCSPDTFPITDGQTYHPQGSPCHYLSGFVDDTTQRIGQVFKGDPGSATAFDWHFLQGGGVSNAAYGDTNEPVLFDPSTVLTPGDHMFTAIFARHVVQDVSGFQNYFETFATSGATPPNQDYRVIRWVYGN